MSINVLQKKSLAKLTLKSQCFVLIKRKKNRNNIVAGPINPRWLMAFFLTISSPAFADPYWIFVSASWGAPEENQQDYGGIRGASILDACQQTLAILWPYPDNLTVLHDYGASEGGGSCEYWFENEHAGTAIFYLVNDSCPAGSSLDGNGQCICISPLVMNGAGNRCISALPQTSGINFGVPGAGPATPPVAPPTPSEGPTASSGPEVVIIGGGNSPSCNSDSPVSPSVADPINIAVGNLYETETDYAGKVGGGSALRIERTYNSLSGSNSIFGNGWSSNLDTQSTLDVGGTSLTIHLANGQVIPFIFSSGLWVSSSPLPVKLVANSSGYLFTTYDKRQYQFDTAGHLTSLTNAQGEKQIYLYTDSQLTSVTDNYGNSMSLTYNADKLVDTIIVDGQSIRYSYNTTTSSAGYKNLIGAIYPATAGSGVVTRQYLYENAQFPWALTGLIDETGKRISTWGYNAQGLANSNNRAGSENFTIDYTHIADAGDPYSLVTNAKNYSWKYHLQTGSDGSVRMIRIEGLGTANCAAGSNYTSYDTSGHAITVTDGNGNVTLRHYAANGLVDQETRGYRWASAPTGNIADLVETTTMRKLMVTQWDATNAWPQRTIYSGKSLTGNWTQYQQVDQLYDAHGRVQSKTLTDLTNLTVPYNSNGQVRNWTHTYTYFDSAQTKVNTLVVQGPGGANDVSTSTYDSQGHLTEVVQKATATQSLTTAYSQFNAAGLPQRVTDPNSVPTQLIYDPRNRLHQVVLNVGAGDAQTITMDYYDNGLMKQVTLGNGSWLKYIYSDGIHLSRIDDNLGNYIVLTPSVLDGQWIQQKVYDSTGALQQTQNRVFDDLGRLLQRLDATGTIIRNIYAYDVGGNLQSTQVGTDFTTAIVRAYDSLKRLQQLNTPDGNHSTYKYDAMGNLAQVIDPRGIVTQYTYDGLGDLMQEQSPDRGLAKFWYDAVGNNTKKIDARTIESDYAYDALNRVTSITYPASAAENASFTYDSTANGNKGIGKLTFYSNDGGSTLFVYDSYGNVAQQTEQIGSQYYVTAYQYDSANRISQITYPSGRIVMYTRNALGQITQLQTKDTSTSTALTLLSNASYYSFGPLNTLTYGNGVTSTLQRDADYRVSRITANTTPLLDFLFSYDAAGNVTQQADQTGGGLGRAFGYDALNRVTSDTNSTGTWTYEYDANSNRTKRISSNTQTLTYATNSNRMTKNVSTTQTLDAVGNLITNGTKTYVYNNANRLRTYSVSGTVKAQMQYNAIGQRTAKLQISKPMHFHYDLSGRYLGTTAYNSDGTLSQRYEWVYLDDMPIAQVRTNYGSNNAVSSRKTTYIHTDHLNTPRVMSDGAKRIVWFWDGDAYGQIGPNQNPDGDSTSDVLNLRFPGQYYDAETGLYYNIHRDYDPGTGRYIESDPIGLQGGLNTYTYVHGNPLKYVDPLGLEAELCARQFYPVPVPYARHCFVRFNGDNGDTSSFDNKGVHPDPNPKNASCQKTEGDRDDCVKREMQKCKASDYNFTGFNCCHCAEQALKACGINTSPVNWPNWPVNPGPQPGE